MNNFYESYPGKVFKPERGKLYVFKQSTIQVMKVWPIMLAWGKTQSIPYWHPIRPDIKLPKDDLDKTIEKFTPNDHKVEQIKDLFDANWDIFIFS